MDRGMAVQITRGPAPKKYTAALTGIADGSASATITLDDAGWACQVELVPGTGGAAPAAFTTLTVANSRSVDILTGQGAGSSVSVPTLFPFGDHVWVDGTTLTVSATGIGEDNTADVYVFVY